MRSLSDQIMEYAEALPEGSPLCPNDFLHLGSRPAVYQALSRLTRQDRLMRIFQGVYVKTIETRFGICGPKIGKVIEALSKLWERSLFTQLAVRRISSALLLRFLCGKSILHRDLADSFASGHLRWICVMPRAGS